MADEPKKKKNKSKKSPKKVLEDALKGASSSDEKAYSDDVLVADGVGLSSGAVEPPAQPGGYEECVFSIKGTTQSEASAAAEPVSSHKYDEMKFAEEGKKDAETDGANHSYNEVTFHQPGSEVAAPKLDPIVRINQEHSLCQLLTRCHPPEV